MMSVKDYSHGGGWYHLLALNTTFYWLLILQLTGNYRLSSENLVVIVFFQGETLSASPPQKFQEVQTGIKDLVMLEHHLVKGINGEVTVGVSIFQRGHGGIKCVGLMAKRGVFHGDYLESMLERKKEYSLHFKHLNGQNTELIVDHCNRKCVSGESLCSSETQHLSNVVCSLPQGFKDLFVVFQVDISEHVSGHFISFAQVSLQAFFVDLPLKLCYDRSRLNQTDTENKEFNMLRYSRMAPSVNTDL